MPKRISRNPDHVQRHNTPSPNNEASASQLSALLTPAIFAQQGYYRQLGLRDRILNLSLMVAVVLTRFVATSSGCTRIDSPTGTRRLTMVSSYKSFPTSSFRTILDISRRIIWRRGLKIYCHNYKIIGDKETSVPYLIVSNLPESILNGFGWLTVRLKTALFRKLKSLEDVPRGQLVGKICTVIDIVTRLPVEVWFHSNPKEARD